MFMERIHDCRWFARLIARYTFVLALNIDWFQPYQHTAMSVGIIYLTVLNLLKLLRYSDVIFCVLVSYLGHLNPLMTSTLIYIHW